MVSEKIDFSSQFESPFFNGTEKIIESLPALDVEVVCDLNLMRDVVRMNL